MLSRYIVIGWNGDTVGIDISKSFDDTLKDSLASEDSENSLEVCETESRYKI